MANKQIKDFDEVTSPKNEDVVLIQQDADNVTKKVKAENVIGELNAQQLRGGASSVLISGCDVSINAGDNTKLDISAGELLFQDNTDPNNPTIQRLSFPGATGYSPICTESVCNLKIDSTGTIQETAGSSWDAVLSNIDSQVVIAVFQKLPGAGAQILAVNSATNAFMGPIMRTLSELALVVGIKSITGNFISAVSSTSIQKTAGKMFQIGSNFKIDSNNPNIRDTPLLNGAGADLIHIYRDGSGGLLTQAITKNLGVGTLDNGTGTLTTYPNNQYGNFRLYLNSSNQLFVAYPQFSYGSLEDSLNAISTEAFEKFPDAQTALLICVITAKGNADLTASGEARFVNYGD